jgi:hypothetical protein
MTIWRADLRAVYFTITPNVLLAGSFVIRSRCGGSPGERVSCRRADVVKSWQLHGGR